MIGRMIGGATATIFTAVAVTGIAALIVSDFGEIQTGWKHVSDWFETKPEPALTLGKAEALKDADNITFFHSEEIEGSDLKVTTGIAFASVEDVVAGKTINRWCYIQSGTAKFTERLDLGGQKGLGSPKYTDTTIFTAEQLKGFGLDAEQLAGLARSHCLLKGFDPRTVGKHRLSKQFKQNGQGKITKHPAKVWNWQQPDLWRGNIYRRQLVLIPSLNSTVKERVDVL